MSFELRLTRNNGCSKEGRQLTIEGVHESIRGDGSCCSSES